jgi:hypothetical protein
VGVGGGYTFWANNAVVTDFLKNSSHHLPPKPTTYSINNVLMAKVWCLISSPGLLSRIIA